MWLIVVNGHAGRGKAGKLAADLASRLRADGQTFKVIEANSSSETQSLLKSELDTGIYKQVVAVGGDGLVNLCLQCVAEGPSALTVIPAGTGNDFARAVGTFGKSVADIYDGISRTEVAKIDLGKISGSFGERWYAQILSTGFDALVNSSANKMNWPIGKLKYTVSTLLTLARFKSIEYHLDIDGKQISMRAMLLSVANGQTYGGGMRICPSASNSDGYFDVFIVEPVSRLVLLSIFPKIFFGKHIPHPKIQIIRAKQLRLDAKTIAHADGEFVSELPVSVSNIPGSLNTWLLK